jgi:large subunit ribosomal protein L7Ae
MPKRSSKKKTSTKKSVPKEDPLYAKNARSFRIGGDVPNHKRDLSRFVKWPKYIRLQRQKKVLMDRLKTPPSLNQFNDALDKNQATELFKLLNKYRPETKKEKKERLKKQAAAEAGKAGAGVSAKPPPTLKFGLNHITHLIEKKKAKLVCIASDVQPIELVVWLPALCKSMGVPYCIVKNKSRLGSLVNQKNATAVALTAVNGGDNGALDTMTSLCKAKYNDGPEPKWGDRTLGLKTQRAIAKREAELAAEAAKRAKY